jgi:hypothetical protein
MTFAELLDLAVSQIAGLDGILTDIGALYQGESLRCCDKRLLVL